MEYLNFVEVWFLADPNGSYILYVHILNLKAIINHGVLKRFLAGLGWILSVEISSRFFMVFLGYWNIGKFK